MPQKYIGSVGFDRPPISDMARDPKARAVFNAVKAYIDDIDSNLADGRGLWLEGVVALVLLATGIALPNLKSLPSATTDAA